MQVDVEGANIEKRQVEKFSRREVDVGEERVRRGILRALEQRSQEALDPQAPVPADDARRDLVADGEERDGRMRPELADPRDDLTLDRAIRRAIVEKRHVLHPWESHHHAQPVAGGLVEQV